MKTPKRFIILAALFSTAWLSGCATTPEGRIKDDPATFAQLTPQEQTLVRAGQVGIGFGEPAVKLALGKPDSVTIRTYDHGQSEVWHYSETGYYDGAYIYGGPNWGGWRRRGWEWGGYSVSRPYPVVGISTYDNFRVDFRNGKVVAFSQEIR